MAARRAYRTLGAGRSDRVDGCVEPPTSNASPDNGLTIATLLAASSLALAQAAPMRTRRATERRRASRRGSPGCRTVQQVINVLGRTCHATVGDPATCATIDGRTIDPTPRRRRRGHLGTARAGAPARARRRPAALAELWAHTHHSYNSEHRLRTPWRSLNGSAAGSTQARFGVGGAWWQRGESNPAWTPVAASGLRRTPSEGVHRNAAQLPPDGSLRHQLSCRGEGPAAVVPAGPRAWLISARIRPAGVRWIGAACGGSRKLAGLSMRCYRRTRVPCLRPTLPWWAQRL
jgi:hypothetical protein